MAKFYVQSGSFRGVIEAESSSKAAIWAVHQVMRQIAPVEGDGPCDPGDQPPVVLADRIRVDVRGYDRADATSLRTTDLIAQWSQMVVTLDRLQQMLAA